MAAFLLMLREGVEAALVVGILLAYLTQLGRREDFKFVWWGTGAAAALSFGIGWVIYSTIGELDATNERIAGGLVAFAACALLTWMIFWMAKQSRSIKPALHSKVDQAVATGSAFAIGTVAFVAVLREGLESALFLISTTMDPWLTDTAEGNFIPTLTEIMRETVLAAVERLTHPRATAVPA